MELKKISYKSTVFFAALGLIVALIFGLFQLFILKTMYASMATMSQFEQYADTYIQMAQGITVWSSLIYMPVLSTLITAIIVLAIIGIYNLVAKKYPISWDIEHKK